MIALKSLLKVPNRAIVTSPAPVTDASKAVVYVGLSAATFGFGMLGATWESLTHTEEASVPLVRLRTKRTEMNNLETKPFASQENHKTVPTSVTESSDMYRMESNPEERNPEQRIKVTLRTKPTYCTK